MVVAVVQCPQLPYDCFISYASPDLAHAEALHRHLIAAGFSVWFDKVHLRERYGSQWHAEIEAGCEASRIVLPVLTPRWKRSQWTRYETYGAEAVIPIVFEGAWDDVKTPPLTRWQSDIVGTHEWDRLIPSIQNLLAQPAPDKTARVAHLHYRPTPYFVGREKDLDEIHEKLFTNPTAVLTQGHVAAVTALGGVGKTTLARQYAEKFWRCYRQMFWADCRRNLASEFALIHDILRPDPRFSELKDADKAAWVRAELSRTEGPLRLLILDNAEDEDAVKHWIPPTGNCHTLITSRFTAWSHGVETCPVWVLEPEPARQLLLRRSGRGDAGGADALAKKLEYLPLALEQAAAYIAEEGPGWGFAEYLRLYGRHESELLARGTPGATDYPDSVYLTWRATIDKLPPGARAVLRLCGFLAPTPIPTRVLVKGARIVEAQASEMGLVLPGPSDEFQAREWKKALVRYSMVRQAEEDGFLIHGLVQAVERRQVAEREQPRMIERTVELVMAWAPRPSHEHRNWQAWRVLEPHARLLWEAQRAGETVRPDPQFLNALGTFLQYAHGAYADVEPMLQRALEARERVLGTEHPDTLASLNNLAGLYAGQGRYAEAEPLYQRALEASGRVLGAEHPHTLSSVNNLAALYASQGRYAEAEPLYRRALEASGRVLGAEHPSTLISVNNLAGLYLYQGRYAEAEPLYQRALEARERVLGAEHPDTLVSVNNLAELYGKKGLYAEAEPLFQRALDATGRVLGAEHPDTLSSVNNLAGLYARQGRYAEAEPLLRRALEASERVLGVEHPSTLVSVNSVAVLYESQGRYAEAEPLYQRALEASERVLGAEHPDTLVWVNNLAGLYARQGRYAEAEPLCQRALEARERVLGAEHPDTLASVNNLAFLYARQGRYAEAEPLYQRALRGAERVLGPEHPHTRIFRKNLERLRERQSSRFPRALRFLAKAIGLPW